MKQSRETGYLFFQLVCVLSPTILNNIQDFLWPLFYSTTSTSKKVSNRSQLLSGLDTLTSTRMNAVPWWRMSNNQHKLKHNQWLAYTNYLENLLIRNY